MGSPIARQGSMRLVSALLFVALTGSISVADDAKPADPKPEVTKPKVPLRVVRMLPETHQVLLFDRIRGTHVVAEAGQEIDGFVVEAIDDDEVTLTAPSGAEVILAAPDATWRKRAADRRATRGARPHAVPELQPVDPYADAPSDGASAPIVAGEGGIRVASAADQGPTAAPVTDAAPSDPYGDPGIAAFADAVGATTAPAPPTPTAKDRAKAPATKSANAAASTDAAGSLAAAATGSAMPATTAPVDARVERSPAASATATTITRADVDTALADFGATAVTFDAAFVGDGLRFEHIAGGTILAKVGLRAGDVLTAVDGKPLRSLDDAASLYARVGTARSATLSVLRAGKPVTLKVTIR